MIIQKRFKQLTYREALPAPEVADLIAGCCWIENTSTTPQSFTVLPDGYIKVLLIRQLNHSPHLLLSGIWTQAHDITVAAQSTIVGIRFTLLAAEHLIAKPVPLNTVCSLPLTSNFGELLLTAPTLEELAWRITALCERLPCTPRQRALFSALYQGAGRGLVSQVAMAAGWSPRQLHRYFQTRFSCSCKKFSNVVRSYTAARQLRASDLFAAGSFCDQSHGIRQIKQHAGVGPRQLYRQRHDRFIQLCPPEATDLCPT